MVDLGFIYYIYLFVLEGGDLTKNIFWFSSYIKYISPEYQMISAKEKKNIKISCFLFPYVTTICRL